MTMAPDRGFQASESLLLQELGNVSITSPAAEDFSSTSPGQSEVIPPHLSHDPATSAKRSDPFQFGQRYLSETDNVFEFNAWDHVAPDDEHLAYCREQYERQKQNPVSEFDKSRFNAKPEKWWDLFYKQKTSTFFKDRKWLTQEFPILKEVTRNGSGKKTLLEVGAGAGNTAFPLLRMNENADLMIHAYDFSKKAVETIRNASEYDEQHIRAEVWDVALGEENEQGGLPPGLGENSVDVVIMIFIFSALNPQQWRAAVHNVWRVLRPGGQVLFRDYGRGDLAQVRFKSGRWMGDNFYIRGDGTRVYFFERDELEGIWTGRDDASRTEGFKVLNLDVDRRLIVNRQRQLKMYRCWIQGRFEKPSETG